MSSGSSNMAGGALGTSLSLLLLASIIQGLRDLEIFHHDTMEAEVGQDVALPCIIKSSTDLKLVNTEWNKKENELKKLALYTPGFGINLFTSNVNITVVNNDANNTMGSYLQLHKVEKGNSGIYVCDTATYPLGSIRAETVLKIKDVIRITCDTNSTVEVHSGENVTIYCTVDRNAQYKWSKNKELVSQKEFLELWRVTDAHAGVYNLTVNTGNETLYKDFIITILATTTSSRRDVVTVPPRFNVTEQGLTKSTIYTDTSVAWTMSTGASATDINPNPSNVTITDSFTIDSVTSSPAPHTEPYNFYNSTTLSYDSTMLANDATRNDIMRNSTAISAKPAIPTLSAGNTTDATEANDIVRSHLLSVFIIVPTLILVAVAAILHMRQIIKLRMDGPPPFKPPPPPVKFVRYGNNPAHIPISRCNSVTEFDQNYV
ncbi:hypothetical protein PAMP_007053 [Pampus punctatissimus]